MFRTLLGTGLALIGGVAAAQTQAIPAPGSGQPQPGGVPVVPVVNPQEAFARLPAKLQQHLLAWEKKTQGMQSFYVECDRVLTKDDLAKKVTRNYTGFIRCMKPNLAYLKIDNVNKKDDFEAYICDGQLIHVYEGADKVVKQFPIPPGGKGNVGDNLLLEFMSGAMSAADTAARFQLSLIKEDQHYVYIQVLPTLKKDVEEFDSLILVLFGPSVQGMDYLPAKVQIKINNNQVIDEWTFKKPMVNPQGIKEADFRFVQPPRDWQIQPPAPKAVRP